jgi:hypothetical protein
MSSLTKSLDLFTRAYLRCALWSSNDNSTESGGEPLDRNYIVDDIAEESVKKAIEECREFQNSYPAELDRFCEERSIERAGHNFWLNRNGHGSGFWDEGYGETKSFQNACAVLSKASKECGTSDAYIGDDGKVYLT